MAAGSFSRERSKPILRLRRPAAPSAAMSDGGRLSDAPAGPFPSEGDMPSEIGNDEALEALRCAVKRADALAGKHALYEPFAAQLEGDRIERLEREFAQLGRRRLAQRVEKARRLLRKRRVVGPSNSCRSFAVAARSSFTTGAAARMRATIDAKSS